MVIRDIRGPGRPATSVYVVGQDRPPTATESRAARAAIAKKGAIWTTRKLVRGLVNRS